MEQNNTPLILQQNILALPPLPNYTHIRPLKYLPQYSYCMDGSFKPPKEIRPHIWKEERARYDLYNLHNKNTRNERLRGLQNILTPKISGPFW
jgi:hypothetical protein